MKKTPPGRLQENFRKISDLGKNFEKIPKLEKLVREGEWGEKMVN